MKCISGKKIERDIAEKNFKAKKYLSSKEEEFKI